MANNFSDAFAAWLFASGALTVDSIGTNTLTPYGSIGSGTAIQGAASVAFDGASKYLGIADADLAAGFPFKDGDTGKLITVCFKIRYNNAGEMPTVGKLSLFAAQSFGFTVSGNSAFEGDSTYLNNLGLPDFVNGHEYQIVYTIDGAGKKYSIYVHDYATGGFYVNHTTTNAWTGSTLDFLIGRDVGRYYAYGEIGEIVVFNRILNLPEMEAIKGGNYSGPISAVDFAPHDLTSDTSHSPFVVSSSAFYGSSPPWAAFDGTTGYFLGTTGGAVWLALDIGSGNTKILQRYTVKADCNNGSDRAPKDWTMEGSNDESTWYTLDTVTNQTSWGINETRSFVCDTVTTPYRYFRLNITANNGFSGTEVSELYLYYKSVFTYVGQIPLTLAPQSLCFSDAPHLYAGSVPLTLAPQSLCFIDPKLYAGSVPLTLTPESTYFSNAPHLYTGSLQLALLPNASCELVAAVISGVDVIPASTGGWAMGGAGVWGGGAPTSTIIPADLDPTGFYLGGGTEAGEPEVVSTIPAADEIAAEVAFKFCGPGATGNATTTEPAQDVIEDEVAFAMGGAGVWGQVAPGDIPSAVLVPTGGFVLSGSGFTLDPAVTPTATVIVSTGGFVLGGLRPDQVEVTYPELLDRVIEETAAFEMGGEGVWGGSLPATTVIVSKGAIFALGGAGLATTRPPPIAVITGDATGGFVLSGSGFTLAAEVYEAWVLSGQAFEPSVWSSFNFNSFATKGGLAYAAGEDGIYLLGADHDAGETIHTGARIGPVNFGADRDKRIRGIQFGQGGKDTRVRVKSENGDVGVFEPERDENRVVVSRNIQGRQFTVDILDFEELSQLEIMPLRLARR